LARKLNLLGEKIGDIEDLLRQNHSSSALPGPSL
jgi:hypothetical protein